MEKHKAVRRAEDLEEAVRGMKEAGSRQQDKVSMELTGQPSSKQKKEIKHLEPSQRIPTGGVRHPKMEEQREYLYEWVEGMFENKLIGGEGISFWLTGLPGDDYCLWVIPANRPVAVPRFVAQHLSQGLQWKEPRPLGATQDPRVFDEMSMMAPFEDLITKKRGTFSPLSVY